MLGHAGLRADGSGLWEGGQGCAAHRLEVLWNEALPARNVELLCSYDVSGATASARERLREDVLQTHGHLTT